MGGLVNVQLGSLARFSLLRALIVSDRMSESKGKEQ
jgi:hypothetical protein